MKSRLLKKKNSHFKYAELGNLEKRFDDLIINFNPEKDVQEMEQILTEANNSGVTSIFKKLSKDIIEGENKIPFDLLKKFADNLDWKNKVHEHRAISASSHLSPEFIEEFKEYIDFYLLVSHSMTKISDDFVSKYAGYFGETELEQEKVFGAIKRINGITYRNAERRFSHDDFINSLEDEETLEQYNAHMSGKNNSNPHPNKDDILEEHMNKLQKVQYTFADLEYVVLHVLQPLGLNQEEWKEVWDTISRYQQLVEIDSTHFVERYHEKLNWDIISSNQELTEEFMNEHLNDLEGNWDKVSKFQKLSSGFINKHADKLNWGIMATSQKLNESIILANIDAIKEEDLIKIIKNIQEPLSDYFFKTLSMESSVSIKDLISIIPNTRANRNKINQTKKHTLHEDFVEKDISDASELTKVMRSWTLPEKTIEKYQDSINWVEVVKNQNLSEDFIEKYSDKLDWSLVSEHQKLSTSFIQKHEDDIDFETLSSNHNIEFNHDLLDKYIEKMDLMLMLVNEDIQIPEDVLDKHSDSFTLPMWKAISIWKSLTEKFMNKYREELDWKILSETQQFTSFGVNYYKFPINIKIFEEKNKKTKITDGIKRYLATMK